MTDATAKGAYISWLLDHRSARDIYGWARMMGVSNICDPDEMHCTIMCDPERALDRAYHGDRPLPNPVELGFYNRPATRILGPAGDKGALVTAYDSDILDSRHRFFRDHFGLKPTFPTFIPHVTLSYDAHSQDPEVLRILTLVPCRLPIVLNRERITNFE